ncbi:hypothetical protein HDU92_007187 [Lobulomyces angularis]|nr:hypothetical protein HDU92_007187 [Lobulomyces angularis]
MQHNVQQSFTRRLIREIAFTKNLFNKLKLFHELIEVLETYDQRYWNSNIVQIDEAMKVVTELKRQREHYKFATNEEMKLMYKKSKTYKGLQEFDLALKFCSAHAKLAKETKSARDYLMHHLLLGDIYFELAISEVEQNCIFAQRNFKLALDAFEYYISHSEVQNADGEILKTRLNRLTCKQHLKMEHNFSEEFKELNKSAKDDPQWQHQVLLEEAKYYEINLAFKTAKDVLKKDLVLCKTNNINTDDTYWGFYEIHLQLLEFSEAKMCLSKVQFDVPGRNRNTAKLKIEQWERNMKSDLKIINNEKLKVKEYELKRDYNGIFKSLEKVVLVARKIEWHSEVYENLIYMKEIFAKFQFSAKEYFFVYSNLAAHYFYRKNYEKSLHYFEKTESYLVHIDDSVEKANILQLFGGCCSANTKREKALRIYKTLHELGKNLNNEDIVLESLQLTKNIYVDWKNYSKVKDTEEQINKILEKRFRNREKETVSKSVSPKKDFFPYTEHESLHIDYSERMEKGQKMSSNSNKNIGPTAVEEGAIEELLASSDKSMVYNDRISTYSIYIPSAVKDEVEKKAVVSRKKKRNIITSSQCSESCQIQKNSKSFLDLLHCSDSEDNSENFRKKISNNAIKIQKSSTNKKSTTDFSSEATGEIEFKEKLKEKKRKNLIMISSSEDEIPLKKKLNSEVTDDKNNLVATNNVKCTFSKKFSEIHCNATSYQANISSSECEVESNLNRKRRNQITPIKSPKQLDNPVKAFPYNKVVHRKLSKSSITVHILYPNEKKVSFSFDDSVNTTPKLRNWYIKQTEIEFMKNYHQKPKKITKFINVVDGREVLNKSELGQSQPIKGVEGDSHVNRNEHCKIFVLKAVVED